MDPTTHPAPTVPPPNPNDNPNPAPDEEHTPHACHNDNGANGNGNGNGGDDPMCLRLVEESLERAEHIDALAHSAQHLINDVPRIGNPDGERAFTRLARTVEQLSGFAVMNLQHAEGAVEIVRARKGGDDGNSGEQ